MIYISAGCEGSSAVGLLSRLIISNHTGYQIFGAPLELIRPHNNYIYTKLAGKNKRDALYSQELMVKAIGSFYSKALKEKKILFFKATDDTIRRNPGLLNQLVLKYGARLTYI